MRPAPYLHCPTLDSQKALIRALYGAGYKTMGYSLDYILHDMTERSDEYLSYTKIGVVNDSISWMPEKVMATWYSTPITPVNSISHMLAYLKRNKP